MNWSEYIDVKSGNTGVSGAFCAYGSFGVIDGNSQDTEAYTKTENGYKFENNNFCVSSAIEEFDNDICIRKDVLTAGSELTINKFMSRFLLEGGDYEVYTQYNSWQHESLGGWHNLVTGIEISNLGIRTAEGAAPMAVIRNKGNNRMFVIHLIPNASWKIIISKKPVGGKNDGILIEAGINDNGLNLKCASGETIQMPEIIFYTTANSIDFDAWKLHALYNKLYPRKALPVIFNTWMYTFDKIDIEDMYRQIDTASRLGIEMFLVDAGWFGVTESWSDNIGEWTENLKGGFKGKLSAVSEYTRAKGLTFGMWIEPERALDNVSIVKEHPEYFMTGSDNNRFLDFSNESARKYIFDLLCGLIDKYRLGLMKFDFNSPLAYDISGNGFYRYFQGQKQLIMDLKNKYPDLYIINCASGGARMDMGQQQIFDSIWYSDNQGPVAGLRIIKDTSLRLPPNNLERWDVRLFCNGFLEYQNFNKITRPISCDGATWSEAVIVNPGYTHAFISGGVMGFSANIADYPDEEKDALKQLIVTHKKDREFYKNAVMRILYDTDNITVFQYSDTDLKRIIIQIFCNKVYQEKITLYPVLNNGKKYISDKEKIFNSDELINDGITVNTVDYDCIIIEYKEVK